MFVCLQSFNPCRHVCVVGFTYMSPCIFPSTSVVVPDTLSFWRNLSRSSHCHYKAPSNVLHITAQHEVGVCGPHRSSAPRQGKQLSLPDGKAQRHQVLEKRQFASSDPVPNCSIVPPDLHKPYCTPLLRAHAVPSPIGAPHSVSPGLFMAMWQLGESLELGLQWLQQESPEEDEEQSCWPD